MTNYHPEYVPTISTMTSPMQYIEDYLRQEFFATELYTNEMMANERLATIEINIKTLKVVDVRAKYDRKPERESDIMQALNNNMSMFKIKKAI